MVWRLGFQRMVLVLAALAGSVYAAFLLFHQSVPMEEQKPVCFPCALTEDLTVHRLTGYDGPFLEDGSMEEVVDTAALVLENRGYRHIRKVSVCILTSSGSLVFTADHLPPQSMLLVLESQKRSYTGEAILGVRQEELSYSNDLLQSCLSVTEEKNGVAVTNLTENLVENAVLYYKQYDAASQMYIGGAARSCYLKTLEPMETVTVFPLGFLLPYCKVAAIELIKQ